MSFLKTNFHGQSKIALTDFDGTLISGNLGGDFFRWLREKSSFITFCKLFYRKLFSSKSYPTITQFSADEFNTLLSEFYASKTFSYRINWDLVDLLTTSYSKIYIISGSPEFLIRKFISDYIPQLADVEVVGLTYDGFVTRPYGVKKVILAEERGVKSPFDAFGDSRGDLEMLKRSSHGLLYTSDWRLRLFVRRSQMFDEVMILQRW